MKRKSQPYKAQGEEHSQLRTVLSVQISLFPGVFRELGALIPGCQRWAELFQVLFPWLLSNLFCCLWNHGSFPSMNSFSPCNQLWLVLFNINLFYFFSKKNTNQFCTPCMLKAAPLLLTYRSLNQKGRRKQLGFTSLFFLSKYTNVNFLKDVWHSGVQSCYVQSQLDQKVAGCPLLKWSEKRKPRASLKCEWVHRPLSHVYLHWGHAEPTRELRKCKPLLLHFSIFTFKTRAALSFIFYFYCCTQLRTFHLAL